ncbi:MAG: AtpZ/AtpI family protein [Bellilinea sp.]
MSQPDPSGPSGKQKLLNLALASIAGQVGCLTLVIILGAVFLGLWLDSRLGTRPWWTIGLVLGSIPVSLVVMLFVVRLAVSKINTKTGRPQTTQPEETDLGDNS